MSSGASPQHPQARPATFLSIDSSLSGVESFHDLSDAAAAEEGQCEPKRRVTIS
jgi:hypothetical protein